MAATADKEFHSIAVGTAYGIAAAIKARVTEWYDKGTCSIKTAEVHKFFQIHPLKDEPIHDPIGSLDAYF